MAIETIDLLDSEFEDISVNFPTTVADLDAAIGKEGAALDEALSNLLYRNTLPRIYSAASKEVASVGTPEAPGIGFPKKQAVNKDGTPKVTKLADKTEKAVMESDIDHLRRYNESGTEANTKLGEIFRTICATVPIFVQGERAGGTGKISEGALKAANSLLAMPEETRDEKFATIETTIGGGYKIGRDADGNVTPESVARSVMALEKVLVKKSKAQAASLLA